MIYLLFLLNILNYLSIKFNMVEGILFYRKEFIVRQH